MRPRIRAQNRAANSLLLVDQPPAVSNMRAPAPRILFSVGFHETTPLPRRAISTAFAALHVVDLHRRLRTLR